MPVPVSPQRPLESSQGQAAATPSEAAVVPEVPAAPQQQHQQHRRQQQQQQSPQEPTGETPGSENDSAPSRSSTDPGVLAGYRDCLRETIRYLVEEEKMALDHPVILGLKDHLERQQAYLELEKLSQQLSGNHWQINSSVHPRGIVPRTSGFQVTLVEDDDSDDDEELLVASEDEDLVVTSEDEDGMEELEGEEEEEECEMEDSNDEEELQEDEEGESDSSESAALPLAEELLSDPNVRRELLRMMYQGCDLFASPPPAHHSAILLQW